MIEKYEDYVLKVKDYRFNSLNMSKEYEELFLDMLKDKEKYLDTRSIDAKTNFIKNFLFNKKRNFQLRNIEKTK